MTELQLVTLVYERLKASGAAVTPSVIPRLVTLVPSALRLLPQRVRERYGDADAELYRKDYTVALTAGQGALSGHTALASEPMIPSEIIKVTHATAVSDTNTGGKLYKVGSESALGLPRTQEFAYYAVEDNILYTMMGNSRATLTDNAVVRAGFIPLIENVAIQHDPALIDAMVELATGLVTKAA